jgi:hypothetical protein
MLGAMSDERGGATTSAGGLQFDRAEYAAPGAERACALCGRAIADEYFEAAGHVICPACNARLYGPKGSGRALLRAFWYGAGAALVGTVAWFVMRLTGWELGIVAVGIGLFVGFAVRKGGRGRGGWKFQTLAIALTYVSITAANVPGVLATFAEAPPGGAMFVFACLVVFALAAALPFQQGFGNIIGIIIIGFALYEAWKINRRLPISGPFRLSAAAVRPAPPPSSAAPPPPAAPAPA